MADHFRSQRAFGSARRRAFWRRVVSRFTHRSNDLLPFDEVFRRLPVKGQRSLGLRVVPIDLIVGSVGRYRDFDRAFFPRQTQTRHRWLSVDQAMRAQVALPAVELYKVGGAYFVKDGNHRISVARESGQMEVDAHVTEIQVAVPITPDTDLDALIVKQEYAAFLEETGLPKVRPDAEVELSLPGQYEKLLQHIAVHRWYLGERRGAEVTWEEAVASWYDGVYMPLVRIIREHGILRDFPRRTEADLFLWIAEHFWFIRERHGEVPLEQTAVEFASAYSERRLRRALGVVKRAIGNRHAFRRARARAERPDTAT